MSSERKGSTSTRGISRRDFLSRSAGIVLGAGLGLEALSLPADAARRPREEEVRGKMTYRRLGRTGIMVSVLAGGGMPEALYPRAVELGVNYWHKLGNWKPPETLTSRPRDSYYCDMVIDFPEEERATEQFESGLAKSGLKRIDFFKVHTLYRSGEDIKAFAGVLKAFEKLKKQGKTRWLAISQHSNIGEVLSACIESGLFDAIQLPYNPLVPKENEDVIALARSRNVGVIAMKPMLGGPARWQQLTDESWKQRLQPFFPDNQSLAQALLRFCLGAKGMTAACPWIRNSDQLEDAAAAIERPLTRAEAEGLTLFASAAGTDHCRMCGRCEAACPKDIALADIFRFHMYSIHYGDLELASHLYGKLPPGRLATACDGCGRCQAACPYRLPVISRLREAHAVLA